MIKINARKKGVRIIFENQNPASVGKETVKSCPLEGKTMPAIAPSKAITRETKIMKAVITNKIRK